MTNLKTESTLAQVGASLLPTNGGSKVPLEHMRTVPVPELSFSLWYKWDDRQTIPGRQFAGIYLISLSEKNLEGTLPQFADVSYIGMTNSRRGLAGRIGQFWQGIRGIRGRHAGGDNVYEHLGHYNEWSNKYRIFVAVMPVEFDLETCDPDVLIHKGVVAFLEYEAFSRYCRLFPAEKRPRYN